MSKAGKILTGVKGMPDVLPEQAARFGALESRASKHLSAAGFQRIHTPILEAVDVFKRAVGDASDIVRKEMYSLEDQGGRTLVLRPEGTAGVVRAAIEHSVVGEGEEQRLWYFGPMFRYERPQKGRQRQFFQIGCEVLGSRDAYLDAELIALNYTLLASTETGLGLDNLTVKVNTLGDSQDRDRYRQALVDFATPHADALCEDCRNRLQLNPLRMLDCKVKSCQEILQDAPNAAASLSDESQSYFAQVCQTLEALDVPYAHAPRLVRGLDYYAHTVYEIESSDLGAQATVSAGGRYDDLFVQMGGRETPCFGFAMGVERLLLACEAQAIDLVDRSKTVVAWIAADDAARQEGVLALHQLRAQDAETTWLNFLSKGSVKAQMRAANRSDAHFVLIRGEQERNDQVVLLRRMRDGEEVAIADQNWTELIKQIEALGT